MCVGCVVVVLCLVIRGRPIMLFLVILILLWPRRIGLVTQLVVTRFDDSVRFGQIRLRMFPLGRKISQVFEVSRTFVRVIGV
jgi:hypothetical protein